MSQHAKESKINNGRIPYAPFSIASRSHYKPDKFLPELPKPTIKHVLELQYKGVALYRQIENGQIVRN